MKFLDLEINEEIYKRLVIGSIIVIFVYVIFVLISFSMIKPYKLEKNTIVSTEDFKTEINLVHQGRLRLEIKGWAYKEGQSIETFESYFVLRNRQTNKMHMMKTGMEIVEELKMVDELYDYSMSGLHAQSFLLGLRKGVYDICILYKNNSESILIETGETVTI